MDDAVRAELGYLLGYMRACRQTVTDIESGALPGPEPPDAVGYVASMTWAQARGALQMLEHLRLITNEERSAWEHEAAQLVAPRP